MEGRERERESSCDGRGAPRSTLLLLLLLLLLLPRSLPWGTLATGGAAGRPAVAAEVVQAIFGGWFWGGRYEEGNLEGGTLCFRRAGCEVDGGGLERYEGALRALWVGPSGWGCCGAGVGQQA